MTQESRSSAGERSCYIIALASEWPKWASRLSRLGISEISVSDVFIPVTDYAAVVKRALRRADFALLVLPNSVEEELGSSLLFEAGLAIGINRRLVVIAPEVARVPRFLSNQSLLIGAGRDDLALLKDAISRATRARRSIRPAGERPALSREHVARLRASWATDPIFVEERVFELLVALGMRPQRPTQRAGEQPVTLVRRPDFVVWADELTGLFGAPVLPIEVLVSGQTADKRLTRLRDMARGYDAPILLAVSGEPGEPPRYLDDELGPAILLVGLEDLLAELSKRSFGGALSQLRSDALRALSDSVSLHPS